MWRLADRQIDEFVDRGDVRVHRRVRPAVRHARRRRPARRPRERPRAVPRAARCGPRERTGTVGSTGDEALAHNPLEFLYERFTAYVEDRRRDPRDDVLTGLATATFPDGSIPEVDRRRAHRRQPLRSRSGDDRAPASERRSSASATTPSSSSLLREHRDHIPNFVEECLRIESPVKGDFRLARVTTELGGVDIPAGTTVMVVNGAANRDPGRFEHPDRLPSRARRTRASTSRSATAPTPARVHRSRAPRVASPSSACSTAWTTSGSPRRSTARPAPAATTTCRPTSCAASAAYTSSSNRVPDE